MALFCQDDLSYSDGSQMLLNLRQFAFTLELNYSEAYRRLFNFGAETLQRDYDLERAFN